MRLGCFLQPERDWSSSRPRDGSCSHRIHLIQFVCKNKANDKFPPWKLHSRRKSSMCPSLDNPRWFSILFYSELVFYFANNTSSTFAIANKTSPLFSWMVEFSHWLTPIFILCVTLSLEWRSRSPSSPSCIFFADWQMQVVGHCNEFTLFFPLLITFSSKLSIGDQTDRHTIVSSALLLVNDQPSTLQYNKC